MLAAIQRQHLAGHRPGLDQETDGAAEIGDIDLALANLSKVGINRNEFIDWMENDPDLDPLRGDQRFESLKQVA